MSLSNEPQPTKSPSPGLKDSSFLVRFWGVRGSIPTPGIESIQYGGNTSCVEIRVGGHCLIFDGGTGLRVLGQTLIKETPLEAHLFFTHSHWDRIQGFPFFKPAFVASNCFHIYGASAINGASIKQRLMDQMIRPNFPIPLRLMQATLHFHDIVPGQTIAIGNEVEVETCSLNRFDRVLGYRITDQSHTVVYATDVDFNNGSSQESLIYLARNADLLIYDTAQTEQDYISQGHDHGVQTPVWQMGMEVTKAASVRKLALFHHDPCHSDAWLESMEQTVQSQFADCFFAREGMCLEIL